MNKPIVFALIGCGNIAKRHAEHIKTLAELAAVCDIIPDRADAMAARYSCRAYHDINTLLHQEKGVMIVSVCTPNGLHAAHTILALQAGKHVLCEKPMALTVADCRAMIQAQEASGKHLFIVKQNRFNPPVAALKQAIDTGRLGRIIDVQLNCFWNRDAGYYRQSDWKGRKELDGGILFTQFSHFIDLLYWMFGDVRTVQVLTRNFLHCDTIEFADTGVVILEFESGALGTINFTINSHQKNFEGSLTVFGEKGTIKIGGQYLNVLEYQDVENFAITDLPASRPANDYGFYQGSMSNHDQVFLNVVNVLRHGAAIATTAWEGLKTVEIIERIHARANQPDVS